MGEWFSLGRVVAICTYLWVATLCAIGIIQALADAGSR